MSGKLSCDCARHRATRARLALACLALLGAAAWPRVAAADIEAAGMVEDDPSPEEAPEEAPPEDAPPPSDTGETAASEDSPGDGLGDPAPTVPLGEPAFNDVSAPDLDASRSGARAILGASPRGMRGAHLAGWLELGLTAGGREGARVIASTTELGLRYRVADVVVADASWGLVVAETTVAGEGVIGGAPVPYAATDLRVDAGNPVLSGSYSGRVGRDVELEVGLGVALPVASRAENGADADGLAVRVASEVSHRAALSMRGWWSPWRFAPERFGMFLPLRVAAQIDAVMVEGEGAIGVLVPVLGDGRAQVDLTLQLAAGVGVEVVGPLHLGVRARVVGGGSGVTVPGALVSAEPYARLALDPVHISLRGVINLHGADGLVGSRGPGFGLFLAVGVTD